LSDLSDVYVDAIKKKYGFPPGWVPNWPVDRNRKLGDVGSVVNPGFNQDGVLSDYGLSATPAGADGRSAGPWNLSTRNSIAVDIGTDASVPGWQWIGNAKAGVKVGFGTESGMVMGVGSSHYEILKNLDGLRAELVSAGRSKAIPLGRSVIVEQLLADSGLVLVSDGNTGTIKATTNFDAGIKNTPVLASFAFGFSAKTERASFASNTYPEGFCVAFRVITLGKKGWLWWRHIAVAGAFGVTTPELGIDLLENGLTADDYFAPFPDADFTPTPGRPLTGDDDF
jgi:hypothetical protein